MALLAVRCKAAGVVRAAIKSTSIYHRRAFPCIAERTAIGLLIHMPEPGTMDREQTARLAGLAPCLNESARFKGERHICSGRARVRKTIFMTAFTGAMKWNPDLGVFCRRLMAKGKSRIEAVTACAGVRLGWNDVWTASCGGIAVCQAGGVENNSRKGDRP